MTQTTEMLYIQLNSTLKTRCQRLRKNDYRGRLLVVDATIDDQDYILINLCNEKCCFSW